MFHQQDVEITENHLPNEIHHSLHAFAKRRDLDHPRLRPMLGARLTAYVRGDNGEQHRHHHTRHAHPEMQEEQGPAEFHRYLHHHIDGKAAKVVKTLHPSAPHSQRYIYSGRDRQQQQVTLRRQVEIRFEVGAACGE